MSDEEKPPAWASALQQTMSDGFTAVEKRLDIIEANVELQGGSMQDLARRMTAAEERIGKTEERGRNDSVRAKAMSDVDMAHDAAIASLHEKVDNLTAIGGQILKVAGNPTVRRVGQALAFALLAWLASKGYLHQ
jgi:hypothetical protein